ncbi:uncharacterized protein LOC62_07G008978 [Vanrija pseudolonga]|uniref:Uncharacterized protein n=1 Tax=Vanrija pseudolonga TaxID=143232 RepID=A0AAF0YK12_9TREE|nr:hypothetical protein LOC62_07G008978 [Vanrija pseudolonga]
MRLINVIPLLAALAATATAAGIPAQPEARAPDVAAREGADAVASGGDPNGGKYQPPAPWEKDDQGFTYVPVQDDGTLAVPNPNEAALDPNSANSIGAAAIIPIASIVAAVLKAVMAGIQGEVNKQGAFVHGLIDKHKEIAPDKNVFVFQRFKGFTWTASWDSFQEDTVKYKNKYFGVISFKGTGELNSNGADGGWANWGWYGNWNKDGNKVNFY